MRRDAEPPHLSHESSGVIVHVGTDGFLVAAGEICCHLFGRNTFAVGISLRHQAIHHQGMAVVHEHMAPITGESLVNS